MIDAFKHFSDEIDRKSKYGVWESISTPNVFEGGKVFYNYCSNHSYKKIDYLGRYLSNDKPISELGSSLCNNCEIIDEEKYYTLSLLMNKYENADPEEEVNQGAFVLEWSKIQGDKE